MVSGNTEEAVLLIGKNRGKGNAFNLLHGYTGVRVADCYPGYKNMPGDQQICWSNIIRKARYLRDNGNLDKNKREFAGVIHEELKAILLQSKFINSHFSVNYQFPITSHRLIINFL